MTSPNDTSTGYTFVKVHAVDQSYAVLDPESLDEESSTSVYWDWRIENSAGQFQVMFGVEVVGTKTNHESARVRLLGTFNVMGDVTVDLRTFVTFTAPAILLPYARQMITNLTAQGPFEAKLLSPINVRKLMEFATFEESTGYKQLVADDSLTAVFGDPSSYQLELQSP